MYELLKYVHILCAVIWVGGAFYAQLLGIWVERAADPTELSTFARRTEIVGSRVFVPVAALLFISGAVMTAQAWSFGQPWIVVSVALWVLSAAAGAIYLAPRIRRAADLFDREGPASSEARRLIGRLFVVSRLELVSFAVIMALMVTKPGS